MDGKLTEKQNLFIQHYLTNGFNATKAAKSAGYNENSAYSTGQENLNKPVIKAKIDEAREERRKKYEVTTDNVLKELAKIAFANLHDLFELVEVKGSEEKVYKIKEDLTPDQMGTISQFGYSIEDIKLHDKPKALEMLSRHLGLFNDSMKVEGFKIVLDSEDKNYLED